MKKILPALAMVIVAVGAFLWKGEQDASGASRWDDASMWYQTGQPSSDSLVDVFYVVSTDVIQSYDSDGNEVYRATLVSNEREAMAAEMNYARNMFGGSFNFFSPFYHQFTLRALTLPAAAQDSIFQEVYAEVCESFDYYMSHLNQGRRFILAGFSQGSMASLALLKHMTDEQHSRMVAAYLLGYRLTEEDMQHPHVKAAQSETDLGVTISFNSVASPEALWPLVSEGAAACINPLNWHTDSTKAILYNRDDTACVHVDENVHALIVEGLDMEKYRFPMLADYCKPGNLHHWDLLFYKEAIGRNARLRASRRP